MATSKITQPNVVSLARAKDPYNMWWALYRMGRIYILSVSKSETETIYPSGVMTCPFDVDPSWVPAFELICNFITQNGNPFNISVKPNVISGWNYKPGDASQRFGEIVWFK